VACCLQDGLAETYLLYGDQHLAGRALILKGIFLGTRGMPKRQAVLSQPGCLSLRRNVILDSCLPRFSPRLASYAALRARGSGLRTRRSPTARRSGPASSPASPSA
jgi:hypothetical protein